MSIIAVLGKTDWVRAKAESTRCRVWNMSTFQSKNKSISADPRLVMDRTCCSPSTLLTASSMGLVTVTNIWSIGMTPLSTPITTRGKSVEGNTETGMLKARYDPVAANARIRKIVGLGQSGEPIPRAITLVDFGSMKESIQSHINRSWTFRSRAFQALE